MERQVIIAGNWKMHKTTEDAISFINQLSKRLDKNYPFSIYLAAPFTSIAAAVKASENTPIVVGAQNMHEEEKGAFTGEISSSMLLDIGAGFAILGHSERRHVFNETNATINKKVRRAISSNMQTILCVGETEDNRDQGLTEEVIAEQMKEGLAGVLPSDMNKVVIAYEPVWAIGTGKTATPEIADDAHRFIRQCLSNNFDATVASSTSILYGGSVKPDNCSSLMNKDDIDGALIGGASLQVDSFYEIITNSLR
jgi:triosephosphate isomerase (TIM)